MLSRRSLYRGFAVRAVRQLGDPVLRVPAASVTSFGTPELAGLVDDLVDTMRAVNGAGIAAPQIGISQRVFVVEGKGNNPRYPYKPVIPLTVFINPKIEVLDAAELNLVEGCLSVPGFRGRVTRACRVRVRAQHMDGSPFSLVCSGHAAGTMQHELDHLDALLFPDLAGGAGLMTIESFEQFHGGEDFQQAMRDINTAFPETIEWEA